MGIKYWGGINLSTTMEQGDPVSTTGHNGDIPAGGTQAYTNAGVASLYYRRYYQVGVYGKTGGTATQAVCSIYANTTWTGTYNLGSSLGYQTFAVNKLISTTQNNVQVGWDTVGNFSQIWGRGDTYSSTSYMSGGGNTWSGMVQMALWYYDVPTAPSGNVSASAGSSNGSIDVSWNAASFGGETSGLSYRISWFKTSDNSYVGSVDTTASSTPATSYPVTGLTGGQTYYFKVAGLNSVTAAAGSTINGPYSAASSSVIVPGAYGKRYDSTSGTYVTMTKGYRYDTTAGWTPINTRKRYNGTTWVDFQ